MNDNSNFVETFVLTDLLKVSIQTCKQCLEMFSQAPGLMLCGWESYTGSCLGTDSAQQQKDSDGWMAGTARAGVAFRI